MYVPLLIFVGGGLGAVLRWAVGLAIAGWWGVLVANVVGSLLLGVLVASPLREHAPSMALLGVGLLGGFTTYSTFNVNLLEAVGRSAWGELAVQLGLTVGLSLLAGGLGLWVGSLFGR